MIGRVLFRLMYVAWIIPVGFAWLVIQHHGSPHVLVGAGTNSGCQHAGFTGSGIAVVRMHRSSRSCPLIRLIR